MKAVIFEDELHNAELLKLLLKQCDADITIMAVISSVAEGKKWLEENHKPDILFMDIQLSDGNCFELFENNKVMTPIIFTTAYDNFTLQAFKVNSIDYLMKPIELIELKNALKKFERIKPPTDYVLDITRVAEEFFKRGNIRFIGRINNQWVYAKATDIAYLQFANGIVKAITHTNEKIPIDYSLDQVEKMLDKSAFFRINRQFILHIDAIKKITAYYNSRLILQIAPHVDTDVIISRERVADFKNWLEGKIGNS